LFSIFLRYCQVVFFLDKLSPPENHLWRLRVSLLPKDLKNMHQTIKFGIIGGGWRTTFFLQIARQLTAWQATPPSIVVTGLAPVMPHTEPLHECVGVNGLVPVMLSCSCHTTNQAD